MDADHKRFLRTIVKRVHPDLFAAHPQERACNSDSLKVLNSYIDGVLQGEPIGEVQLEFWVADDHSTDLVLLRAQLPRWGSLGPLFYAFGLIDEDDLAAGVGSYAEGEGGDTNFLSWLSDTVSQAVQTADEHDNLRGVVRELRAAVEDRYSLAAVLAGSEYLVSVAELRRQVEALQTLDTCLAALSAKQPEAFEGLSIRIYHPASSANDMQSQMDGSYNLHGRNLTSYVGEDGTLHVVADRATIQAAVSELDLDRARLLTKVACFWVRRARDLTPTIEQLLGVQSVWCDTRTEHASQKFVLWAGYMLEHSAEFQDTIAGRSFAFSLLVHCDESSPMVDFLDSSSILQVRTDTPWQELLEFMTGSFGAAANQAAAGVAAAKAEEEEILERARVALGVRHIIRVCSSSEQVKVVAAAQRLLDNAKAIRNAGLNLAGASLAIDDCYEVWESGFISIPYDFQVQDLQPRLRKLLGTSSEMHAPSSSAADTSPSSSQIDSTQSAEPSAWQEVGNAVMGPASAHNSEISRSEDDDAHAGERNSLEALEDLSVGNIGDERSQPDNSSAAEGLETDAAGGGAGEGAEPEGFAAAGFVAFAPTAAVSMSGHHRNSGRSKWLRPGWHMKQGRVMRKCKLGPSTLPRMETRLARAMAGSSGTRQGILFRF